MSMLFELKYGKLRLDNPIYLNKNVHYKIGLTNLFFNINYNDIKNTKLIRIPKNTRIYIKWSNDYYNFISLLENKDKEVYYTIDYFKNVFNIALSYFKEFIKSLALKKPTDEKIFDFYISYLSNKIKEPPKQWVIDQLYDENTFDIKFDTDEIISIYTPVNILSSADIFGQREFIKNIKTEIPIKKLFNDIIVKTQCNLVKPMYISHSDSQHKHDIERMLCVFQLSEDRNCYVPENILWIPIDDNIDRIDKIEISFDFNLISNSKAYLQIEIDNDKVRNEGFSHKPIAVYNI